VMLSSKSACVSCMGSATMAVLWYSSVMTWGQSPPYGRVIWLKDGRVFMDAPPKR
jgi:hypothetical protein